MVALSNMPAIGTPTPIKNTNYVSVKYEPSVRMSTYLVCFVIGEFSSTSVKSPYPKFGKRRDINERDVTVWTLPDAIEYGVFARDVAKHSLEYFENLFEIAYPIRKLDLVGIPDFSAGAMENYGLITFRQVCVCV